MDTYIHEFMPNSGVTRRTLALHRSWIEACLGVAPGDVVILEVDAQQTSCPGGVGGSGQRLFPKTGETRSSISVQQLLNLSRWHSNWRGS